MEQIFAGMSSFSSLKFPWVRGRHFLSRLFLEGGCGAMGKVFSGNSWGNTGQAGKSRMSAGVPCVSLQLSGKELRAGAAHSWNSCTQESPEVGGVFGFLKVPPPHPGTRVKNRAWELLWA